MNRSSTEYDLKGLSSISLDDACLDQLFSVKSIEEGSSLDGYNVSPEALRDVCYRFVKTFLVDHWSELASLDTSISVCLDTLNITQSALEDFLVQMVNIQGEVAGVREELMKTTTALANRKLSEAVLWGAISQLLLPPDAVKLLTARSNSEVLGEQYKVGLRLLLQYLQYRRSTWKALDEAETENASSRSSIRLQETSVGEEETLREVRISFTSCKPYLELMKVLDSVTVLSCVKVKEFLCAKIKRLAVPNTNICIQQDYSLKEDAFFAHFLSHAPSLLRHAHSGGIEGEKQSTLVPYRIVAALYKEFRSEYCKTVSSVYLSKFQNYVYDCSALEFQSVARTSLFSSPSAPAPHRYALPQLSNLLASDVHLWQLHNREAIFRKPLLANPLLPAFESVHERTHSYEETFRSLFVLLCDGASHEFLFSFQMFSGDITVFIDTFKPVLEFLLHYIQRVLTGNTTGIDAARLMRGKPSQQSGVNVAEDCYGLLILIRLCHDFDHHMKYTRHLNCLTGFFSYVSRLLWPAFLKLVDGQRISLRCLSPSALAACSTHEKLLPKRVCMVYPVVKSLVEFTRSILMISLGCKDFRPVSGSRAGGVLSEALKMVDSQILISREKFSELLLILQHLRSEVLDRISELGNFLVPSEHQDADLYKEALRFNNVFYMVSTLQQIPILRSEEGVLEADISDDYCHAVEDICGTLEVSKKTMVQTVVQKSWSTITAALKAADENPDGPDAAETLRAAQQFLQNWKDMLNEARDTVHHLIVDPSNEQKIIADVCMECLLLNRKFNALVTKVAAADPERWSKHPLRSLLVHNQQLLSHMRSFSLVPS